MEDFTIQINNRCVHEFYTKNPNINIETMNLLLQCHVIIERDGLTIAIFILSNY